MPPSDQEPRYRLVDSNGNVVGALWGDGNGNVKIADETDTQTTFGPDGISTPALEASDTFVVLSVNGDQTGVPADTTVTFDDVVKDNNDEFTSGSFSPDQTGYYKILANPVFANVNDGDKLTLNVVRNNNKALKPRLNVETGGADPKGTTFVNIFELDSSNNYTIEVKDVDSQYDIFGQSRAHIQKLIQQ